MNASEHVRSPGEVLQAMVATFDSGRLDEVDELVHGEYLDHQGLPHIRPIRGPDGFRQVVEAARSGYEDLSVEIADLVEGVDRAAGRLVWSGVRRTSETSRHETLEIVRVDTGRAIEHWGGHS